MTHFCDWYKEPVAVECKRNTLKGLSKAHELSCLLQDMWDWCFKMPDVYLLVKVKK